MRTITKTVCLFDELSDEAKEKAREWYRRASDGDTYFAECVIDDAKEIGKIIGLDIRNIWFSGFYTQGSGASFDGAYRYVKGSAKALKMYAPTDKTLHAIADRLRELQRRNFYKLSASIESYGRDFGIRVGADQCEDDLKDIFSDFASWIYRQLETEFEYQNSDEQIDESLVCNGYEFDEDGERI